MLWEFVQSLGELHIKGVESTIGELNDLVKQIKAQFPYAITMDTEFYVKYNWFPETGTKNIEEFIEGNGVRRSYPAVATLNRINGTITERLIEISDSIKNVLDISVTRDGLAKMVSKTPIPSA